MTSLKTVHLKTLIAAGALAFATGAAFSQTATPVKDARQATQEKRIDAGVNSGSLTTTEANRMNRQQNRTENVENRAKADGTVTPAERARSTHMENKDSRHIRRQKHDAQTN